MPPKMFIVAGPPGSGKSTAFPVAAFGVDYFNADDHAAVLNNGSYCDIPREIRSRVNVLFEAFVLDHIDARSSFALETTLRSADRRHVDRHLEGAAGPSVCRQCGEAELENVATARVDRLLAAVDSFGGT